ncbi:uncharacterized protein ARMOST_14497 [Armillaria ostoyae]|uniref:DUF6535 domain-containing protein n=1 Tax=Armillaria ostoyae TaxID=47428 RepID=A0A284RQS4_ARMOS|nr:uncharacterized protein ARMOST_14497 [Armillaria ostoyae]
MPSSLPVSDDEEEMKSAEGVSQSDNDQPEVENSTHYSSRRRRKSTRGLMGMKIREYLVKEGKGSDPFDYEQKFPEDKQYEELGPAARVWRAYLKECAAFDNEMVEGWRDGLDVLLVFAGLFSAVVTTFVTQTSQSLQVDYGQVTASLLFELIDVQRAAANGSLVNNVPRSGLNPFSDFHPTTSDSLVNGLWFTSLSFSLTTALFAVLTKQWIHQYMSVPSGTPRDRCRVRQFRYMGLQQWGVAFIIGLLPVLMSASLCIFLVGLVVFLAPLQVSIASVVGSITFISFAAYSVTNFLPIIYPSCPYKTSLSQYIFSLYAYIAHNHFFTSVISPISRYRSESPPVPEKPPIRALREAERAAVEHNADEMEASALSWLFCMSSNPNVQSIVVEAVSALPLNSVASLRHRAKGILEMCHILAFDMWRHPEERKLDRLIRTFFRLTVHDDFFVPLLPPEVERERLSPDIYAELLSILPHRFHHQEIRNLVNAQFTNWTNSDLRLQPIVWGNLLQKLLPFSPEDGLAQWLFYAIPVTYWRIGCTPPLFLTSNGLKICLIPEKDHQAVSLWTAVNKYLYPYVADIILRSHADATDSVYHFGPVDEFPEPKDSRLRSLLKVAGSPSIQKVYGGIPSIDSLFGTVTRSIGHYMAVDSFQLCGDIPSFNLDGDRYAVLKLLYTLVSSSEFGGDASVRSHDLRITLVIFLRVLNSISPCPRFLPEDWCTPTMAATFVRIVFQYDAWASQYEPAHRYNSRLSAAAELVHYFLQFPPVMNEAFSHFVSRRLLGLIASLRGSDLAWNTGLSMILNAFITGLESDVLNPETFQQSIAYLFEPDNLFTVCAVLLTWGKAHSTLRRLALFRRDDPAWPECLTKLDTIPVQFGVEGYLDSHAIIDFREFVEGGCVGIYGIDMDDSQTPRRDSGGSCPPEDSPSRLKLWLNQLWPHRGIRANNGAVVKFSGDGQKFPKDKQYEELGPAARVWRPYFEECAAFDIEMVEGWGDGLDVFLVFLVFSLRWSLRSSHPKMPLIRTLREAEREAFKLNADETDTRAISWLFPVSSNPNVQQTNLEGLPRVCAFTLTDLLYDAHRSDVVDTSEIDRCIRTHLRFQFRDSDVSIRKYDKWDQLTPDLAAETFGGLPKCPRSDCVYSTNPAEQSEPTSAARRMGLSSFQDPTAQSGSV